jgi:hypothetical protein
MAISRWVTRFSICGSHFRTEFAADSPLEEAGIEQSVPQRQKDGPPLRPGSAIR